MHRKVINQKYLQPLLDFFHDTVFRYFRVIFFMIFTINPDLVCFIKLMLKPEFISAKESNVCSIRSIMMLTHFLSEMYHQHDRISYTLYHQC